MKKIKSSEVNITVCIVCALDCEAGPLIRHFCMKAEVGGGPFRIFGNESLRLVVTGVGKEKGEAGTLFLGEGLAGNSPAIWLNIGIAGHPTRRIGEAVVGGKILDSETGKSWFPHLAFRPTLPTDMLITVRKPAGFDGRKTLFDDALSDEALYDMEAAGFYPAALRYSSSELVHCIKIVSDNRKNTSSEIRPARVREWIKGVLPEIEDTLRRLRGLAEKRIPPVPDTLLMKKALDRWHFSEYQRNELGRLLRRVYALKREGMIQMGGLKEPVNSRGFLAHLKGLLDISAVAGGAEFK